MSSLQRYASLVGGKRAFLMACEWPLPSAVHVNTIKTTVTHAREVLDGGGVAYEPIDWYLDILELEDSGPGTNRPYFHG